MSTKMKKNELKEMIETLKKELLAKDERLIELEEKYKAYVDETDDRYPPDGRCTELEAKWIEAEKRFAEAEQRCRELEDAIDRHKMSGKRCMELECRCEQLEELLRAAEARAGAASAIGMPRHCVLRETYPAGSLLVVGQSETTLASLQACATTARVSESVTVVCPKEGRRGECKEKLTFAGSSEDL